MSLAFSRQRAFFGRGFASFALKQHENVLLRRKEKTPVVVVILDGVGLGNKGDFDAVHLAKPARLNSLIANTQRFAKLKAHGTAVGLPTDDDMGNSEVGHNAIGCGRVLKQGASLVDDALRTGKLFEGAGWKHLREGVGASGTLHLIGLLSDGGVHSRYDQMIQIAQGAAKRGVKRIRVHALLDGRDVPDGSSVRFMQSLTRDLGALQAQGVDAQVASGGGRMHVTMDRYEADWSIVHRGWNAHVLGKAEFNFPSGLEAVEQLRKKGVSDQYLPSFAVTDEEGKPVGTINDGDSVLFFNFRGDRAIEISRAFEDVNFTKFDRVRHPKVKYAGIMSYDGDLGIPKQFLVPPPLIDRTSGEFLVHNAIRTFAISETQKYGHVTYFWNGNRSGQFDAKLEKYDEILSDKVEFNQAPDMKAVEIADRAVAAILSKDYDFIRLNFANGDMVGHTGDLQATIRSVQTVDQCLARVLNAVDQMGGRYLVTADHGNADEMVQRDKKGNPMKSKDGKFLPLTSHTLAPVPLCVGGAGLPKEVALKQPADLPPAYTPGLANITATFINLLGFQAPPEMEPSMLKIH